MKKLLTIFIVLMCMQSMAQTPPSVRKKPGAIPDKQGLIKPNTSLVKNQRYYSEDNRYCVVFQEDGNLVLYKFSSATSYKPIWNTHTNGLAIKKCVFQADGNLVLYDYAGKAKWDAWTDAKNKSDKKKSWYQKFGIEGDTFRPADPTPWMVVQNDGNIVIYQGLYPKASSVEWASESFEKN